MPNETQRKGGSAKRLPHEKTWTLAQILSAVKRVLLCPIGDVYEVLGFLHGASLFTHQLPRAGREAEPWVVECLPWVAEVDLSDVTPENYKRRLAALESKYGKNHELGPIPRDHESWSAPRNPIEELVEMIQEAPDA